MFTDIMVAVIIATPLAWIAWELRQSRPFEEEAPVDISPPPLEDALASMPETLRKWIDAESELWAREEMLEVAVRYYGVFGSWDEAEVAVKKAYGNTR